MTNSASKTFGDTLTQLASRTWKTLGLRNTRLASVADFISHYPIPVGLSSPHGTLYGWNIHEYLHGHELETIAFFKKHLQPGDVIADIGTNIGYFTMLFSTLVGENGRVISFEPSSGAYKNLCKAVRGKKNVTTVNKGVFSRTDTLKLSTKRSGDPMGSVMYKRGDQEVEVPVVALRDYDIPFTWAKIDVEGAELEVLRGMKAPIPAVLEVAKGIIEEHGEGLPKFFADIESLGYRIYHIMQDGDIIPYTRDNLHVLQSNIYIEPITKVAT